MSSFDLNTLRRRYGLRVLDIAAQSGLPQDYVQQIDEGKIIALSGDVSRLEKAINQLKLKSEN